ncbi:MAG: TIGR04283 family arsenosugar biosynthesis glycosyltransferase [Anaerolineales bacterium]|jgi:rSAM/selenodomain-associated transferase 2
MRDYSVIIPTLNEASRVADCVKRVRLLAPQAQVIVADGGSTDATQQVAQKAGALVVQSGRGRGLQCNGGAQHAHGDILLFLHVDTQLPRNAFDALETCFSQDKVQIGTFRLRFDWPHPVLRLYSLFSAIDTIFTRFGDQCIVVRKLFFNQLGGFPDWPLFEDVALLQTARRHTRVYSFPATVVTSARRYRRYGVVGQQLKNLRYMLMYLSGVPVEEIAERYRQDMAGAQDERSSS